MDDEAAKTLVRIEASLERVINLTPVPEEQAEKLEEIGDILEKLLEQAEKQTALLEKLWKNDRARD